MVTSVIVGNSLLTGKNIFVAVECVIKNAQARKIMNKFEVGGSFNGYYAMDYNNDVVLMGHEAPRPSGIAKGKIKVKALQVYHCKVGNGLSVEMSVSYSLVTLLSVVETGPSTLKLLVADGESVPGEILEIGNTNTRYRFTVGARNFVEGWNKEGPAHHCAIGSGHIDSKIKKLGDILNIAAIQVC